MKYLFIVFLMFVLQVMNLSFVHGKESKNDHSAHKKEKAAKGHDHSSHEGHSHKGDHKMEAGLKVKKRDSALIKVNGMVCAFCARGIKKNFNKRKEVEKTKVDLDKMEVFIKFKKGQTLSEPTIEKIVKSAGFQYKGLQDAKK